MFLTVFFSLFAIRDSMQKLLRVFGRSSNVSSSAWTQMQDTLVSENVRSSSQFAHTFNFCEIFIFHHACSTANCCSLVNYVNAMDATKCNMFFFFFMFRSSFDSVDDDRWHLLHCGYDECKAVAFLSSSRPCTSSVATVILIATRSSIRKKKANASTLGNYNDSICHIGMFYLCVCAHAWRRRIPASICTELANKLCAHANRKSSCANSTNRFRLKIIKWQNHFEMKLLDENNRKRLNVCVVCGVDKECLLTSFLSFAVLPSKKFHRNETCFIYR